MRLAILSPLNRSGCSVVTTMLAQGAALTQDWKTVVTYTSKARTLPIYLNLIEYTGTHGSFRCSMFYRQPR